MTRAIFGILAILAGIALIRHFTQRKPRYITLSGHRDGKLWVGRIPA